MSDNMIAKSERYKRGLENMKKVYLDVVPTFKEGDDRFMDIMVCGLFADLWDESILDFKSRRLFTMGIIACLAEADVFKIQCICALRNNELTAEQLRELVCHAAPYAGFPKSANLRAKVEEAINEFEAAQAEND